MDISVNWHVLKAYIIPDFGFVWHIAFFVIKFKVWVTFALRLFLSAVELSSSSENKRPKIIAGPDFFCDRL